MNINKKVVTTGLLAGVVVLVASLALNWLWGLILAWVWDKTKGLFKERDVFWRCCQFASAYWLVTIPGMLISYSSFQVSFTMIFTWSISILVQAIVAGLVFVKKNP